MNRRRSDTPRRKIGIFCGYYLPHLGGVERYVDKLSLELIKLGYEIVIVTSNHDNLSAIDDLNGRTVYRLPILKQAKSRYPIPRRNAAYKELLKKIEQENIDVFLLNTRFHLTSMVGAKMGARLGRPVMLIDHGTGHFTVNNPVLDLVGKVYEHALTWLIKRYVDRFYGVSAACNVWLNHFGIKAAGVFYNSIDAADAGRVGDMYMDSYEQDVVVTYAGRIIKEKGILNLLDAFVAVRSANPTLRIKLVIAGDGPLLESIRRQYEDPSVDFLGRLDFAHMLGLYKRTDIFVYPSLYPEGLPTSILEAGLMNCAVIATPRGGTAEVITNNRHGIITDGSVGELTEAIGRLSLDAKQRVQYATALKERVTKVFNWGVAAKAVDKEIKDLSR